MTINGLSNLMKFPANHPQSYWNEKNQAARNSTEYGQKVQAASLDQDTLQNIFKDINLSNSCNITPEMQADMQRQREDTYTPSNPNVEVVDNSTYARENMFAVYDNVDENGKWRTTIGTAESLFRSGQHAIHGFSYFDTDFLTEAANEYAKLEEGQVYKRRAIYDDDFIRNTVNFFTGEDPTQEEKEAVQSQMDEIVKELAAKIKNGEKADVSSLKNTLTIAGKDVTMAQLMEMRDVSQKLSEIFNKTTIETTGASGLTVAMADLYGKISKNPLAEEFTAGIERLANIDINMSLTNWEETQPKFTDYLSYGTESAELFKELRFSSLANAPREMSQTLREYKEICDNSGVYASDRKSVNSEYILRHFASMMNTLYGLGY